MNYSSLKRAEIKSREDIADADRKQRDRAMVLNALTGGITGALSGAGSLLRGIGANRMKERQQIVSKEHVNSPDKRGYTESFIYGQDFSWYNRLLDIKEYARVPNFSQLGNTKFETIGGAPASQLTSHGFSPAGLCVFSVAPFYGCATGSIDEPLNYALIEQVTKIRSKTSVDEQLEASDFGLYEIGCLEILKLIAFAKKVLAAMGTYDHDNAYLGKTIVFDHTGDSPSLIAANLPIWRNTLNLQIKRFNENLPLPSTLAIVERCLWLYSVVLRDSTVRKAQLYTFKPVTVGEFKEDIDPVGVYPVVPTTGSVDVSSPFRQNMAGILTMVTRMITSMINSVTNMHVIRALRSAIPENLFLKIELATKEDELLVLDIDEPLDQVINIRTPHCDLIPSYGSFAVVQTTQGFCRQHWPFRVSSSEQAVGNAGPAFRQIIGYSDPSSTSLALTINRHTYENKEAEKTPLNFYSNEVTEEQIVVGTRMRPCLSYLQQFVARRAVTSTGTASNDYYCCFTVHSAGDSIVCYGKCYQAIGTSTNNDLYNDVTSSISISTYNDFYDGIAYEACKFSSLTNSNPSARAWCVLSNFDWLPPLVISGNYSSSSAYDDAPFSISEQWCNYLPYNQTGMHVLHHACLASEFSYSDITFLNYRG